MPPVGFEPTVPASARPQTYALDRAATGIENLALYRVLIKVSDFNRVQYSPKFKNILDTICAMLAKVWVLLLVSIQQSNCVVPMHVKTIFSPSLQESAYYFNSSCVHIYIFHPARRRVNNGNTFQRSVGGSLLVASRVLVAYTWQNCHLYITFVFIFSNGTTAPRGLGPPYRGFTITHRHTTLGRTALYKWSARRRELCLTTHNTQKTETAMSSAVFEPTIPASERPQTHALEHTATEIGVILL
jgi:hypothetical protein